MSDELSIQLNVVLVERDPKRRDVERDVEDSEEDESELGLRERRTERARQFLVKKTRSQKVNLQGSKPRTPPSWSVSS